MLRRTALGALAGAGVSRFLGPARGTVLLMDFRTRRVIVSEYPEMAGSWLLPPGSTLKPFSLLALMDAGKLAATDAWPCPGKLTIAGRSLGCSHPPIGAPMRTSTALAYPCNGFVAHFAGRFEAGELARQLERAGLASRTGLMSSAEAAGRVEIAGTADACRLQALGESGVLVTPVEMLMAYHRLAARATDGARGQHDLPAQ